MSEDDGAALRTHKRLTKEEMDKHIERVSRKPRPAEVRDPFPVCPSKKISKEEQDRMTERLYTQTLQRRQENLAAIDERTYSTHKPKEKKQTEEECQQTVKWLYDDSLKKKENKMEQLRQRYLYQREQKTMKEPLDQFVQHMYNDRIQKKKDTEKKLYDTYIAPTEIKKTTISRSQADEAANRLCTTKGGA